MAGLPTPQIDGCGRRMMRAAADSLRATLTFEIPKGGAGTSVALKIRSEPDLLLHRASS
jgi:hypothetical protein